VPNEPNGSNGSNVGLWPEITIVPSAIGGEAARRVAVVFSEIEKGSGMYTLSPVSGGRDSRQLLATSQRSSARAPPRQ
jgi:hypothetical protein